MGNGQTDLSGLRILLAEDNALSAEITAELLMQRHATVLFARNGEEAVRLVGEAGEKIDAVLMDVHMPGMNGYEATRAIRATGGGKRLPVFAVTARCDEGERRHALDAGMNAFLAKPLQIHMLAQELSRAYA